MKGKKSSKFQFNFPALLGPCPMLKKLSKKNFFPWTLEISEKKLGYDIKYLSIWSFKSHGSMLKFGFVT